MDDESTSNDEHDLTTVSILQVLYLKSAVMRFLQE